MREGKLVIVPTDTIYGIATKMIKEATIQHLYEVRGREQEPALPFLMVSAKHMPQLTRPNAVACRLARAFWPGPLTLILPPAADLPAYARATPIAIRVPNYPPLMPLLEAVGGYMLITGVYRPGFPPAILVEEAAAMFDEGIELILDGGPSLYGIPSTIIDCVADPPVLVRRGAVPESRLQEVLGLEAYRSSPRA